MKSEKLGGHGNANVAVALFLKDHYGNIGREDASNPLHHAWARMTSVVEVEVTVKKKRCTG